MASYSLLIVDDDPAIHSLVQTIVKDKGWTTATALSGEEALEHLEAQPYDVVLTDILMPSMDGLTLLGRIHEVRPDSKVVIMTAHNRPDRVVGAMRGSAAGYLSKPFTKDQLIGSLLDALVWQVEPDDIEVLSDRPNWISVKASCKLETAERLTQFFRELPADLDSDLREDAATAFRELLINAIEHGGRLDPRKAVELHYIRTETSIVYYIRDPGQGFSLQAIPHAAISHPTASLEHTAVREKMGIRPGGFGLLLLKNFADELLYNSKGNEVILIKRLSA